MQTRYIAKLEVRRDSGGFDVRRSRVAALSPRALHRTGQAVDRTAERWRIHAVPSSHRTPRPRIGGRRVALLGAPAVAVAAPGAPAAALRPGSDGAGDPYFPLAGNGGIDVLHYDLDLDYTPAPPDAGAASRAVSTASPRSTSSPTQDLDRFNLDLRGLTASR